MFVSQRSKCKVLHTTSQWKWTRSFPYKRREILKEGQISEHEVVAWIRCMLDCSMPWNFGEREGPVGSILPYFTGEVPGETGSPGQENKLQHSMTMLKFERMLVRGRKYTSHCTRLRSLEIEIDKRPERALPDQIQCKTNYVHWWKIAKAESSTSWKAQKEKSELINQHWLSQERKQQCWKKSLSRRVFKITCMQ